MMQEFTFPGLATRVLFGSGTLSQAGAEVARLGHSRALIRSTPHQKPEAEALAQTLGPLAAGIFAGAAMHTPTDSTESAVQAFKASGATAVVSLGGGSTTGPGKAIATPTGADQVVIPTTYAGSEMTDTFGETEGGKKTTRRDASIRPEMVIYDVDLTLTLPVALTMTSGMDAPAHAILLPHTAAFNAVAVPELLSPFTETFGSGPGAGLWDFAGQIGAPRRLADLGLTLQDPDRAADIAVQNPYSNPRPFDRADLRNLLQAAYDGQRPTT